jgi:hypothetical protein
MVGLRKRAAGLMVWFDLVNLVLTGLVWSGQVKQDLFFF